MLGGSTQKGIMSIVYGAIVVAIVFVFIIQFRPSSGQKTASLSQQCVVMVRDRCVDPKEFWASHSLIVPRGLDEKRLKAMGIRRQVAEGLLERTLLNQDAARLSLVVSDEELTAELIKGRVRISLPAAHAEALAFSLGLAPDGVRYMPFNNPETKAFDYKVYQRVVRTTTNRGLNEFREMQRQETIAARMRDLVRSRARVSDAEGWAAFQRNRSTAAVDWAPLRKGFFAARFLDTSPKALQAWATAHATELDAAATARKDEYPPGCRKARHVLVKIRSQSQPTSHEREEAQRLIEKALGRVRSGEDFSEVASATSEDKGSAERGGDLGCLGKGKTVKPFEQALFALKKPGDTTDIVETEFGFHVIRLDLVVSDDAKQAQAEARAAITKDLMTAMEADRIMVDAGKKIIAAVQGGRKLSEALDEVLGQLDAQAEEARKKRAAQAGGAEEKDKAKDKAAAAATGPAHPKVESTEPFTADARPIAGAAPGQSVAAIAAKLAKPGDVAGELLKLDDGYAVVVLKDKKPASREDFDKERDGFLARMLAPKAEDLLVDYVTRLKAAAKAETRIFEQWTREPEAEKD
jgi:peptidyl-prolyl cis-trans isomerase D